MGPHADFVCLSKRCRHDGAHECPLEVCPSDGSATVYDLPVKATRCPVCGSKRLQRLYNTVNVASGMARRLDAIAEPAFEEATRTKREAHDARNRPATAVRQSPALAVPINKLAPTLTAMGRRVGQEEAKPSIVPIPGLAPVLGRAPRPLVPKGGAYTPPKEALGG